MYEYFESTKFISLILNNVKGKTLLRALEDFKDDYTPKRILKILMQLCRAVRHLKAKNIIWCNFHHDNIIYDGENAVICGFARSRVKVSRTLNIDKRILGLKGISFFVHNNYKGDARYASPEMIENKYYGLRHDVWGLGVVAFFMFAGFFPFDGADDHEICKKILKDEPDWETLYKRKIDPKIVELIKSMLIKNPSLRVTIRKAMADKVFQILDKDDKLVI